MSIQQVYLGYDENALKTYANVGLFRRAQKAIENVTLKAQSDELMTLQSDNQTVMLPKTGLQTASCDCSAVGACKHILASVLWLQTQTTSTQYANDNNNEINGDINIATETPSEEKTLTALQEILAIDLQAIVEKLPKAKRHNAIMLAIAHKQQDVTNTINIESKTITVRFAAQPTPITYIAKAGFEGMLSKIDKNAIVWHWLALVEVQRQQGNSLLHCQTFLETLTLDHPMVPKDDNAWVLSSDSFALISDLQSDIAQLIAQGLSHFDDYLANRMQLMSILARSENLHRLATHLRQLSGKIHGVLRGEYHHDARSLLFLLAELSAHLYELQNTTGEALKKRRGAPRHSYQSDMQRQSLKLYPLGANWWQSDGGARGITLYFFEPDNAHVLEFTQARGQGKDISFNKDSVWRREVWGTSVQALMMNITTLNNPRFNEQGGLASSGSQMLTERDVLEHLPQYCRALETLAIDDWETLSKSWHDEFVADGEIATCVLLVPEIFGELAIDEIEQCVLWTLFDKNEQPLTLRIDWKEGKKNKIHHLQELIKNSLEQAEPIEQVVATAYLDKQGIRLEPISIRVTGKGLCHLDNDRVLAKKKIQKNVSARLQLSPAETVSSDFQTELQLEDRLCEPVLEVFDSLFSSGRLKLTSHQRHRLQHQEKLAEQAGLLTFHRALNNFLKQGNAETLLQTVFVCQLIRRISLIVKII